MIYYLGELIECGELNVTSTSSIDGWLNLAGETELIRFELDSIEVKEKDVDNALNQQIETFVSQAGSEEKAETSLGQ